MEGGSSVCGLGRSHSAELGASSPSVCGSCTPYPAWDEDFGWWGSCFEPGEEGEIYERQRQRGWWEVGRDFQRSVCSGGSSSWEVTLGFFQFCLWGV